jgi:thioredoxin-like negative regulator of GroEL
VSVERLALVLAIGAAVAVGVLLVRTWNRRQLAGRIGTSMWHHLGVESDGRATLVTFSTPSCAACHQAQAPAVKMVTERVDVRHISIDAASQPEVASAFGVMTVPATAILTAAGHLTTVNQGFAPSTKLLQQLHAVA